MYNPHRWEEVEQDDHSSEPCDTPQGMDKWWVIALRIMGVIVVVGALILIGKR